MKDDYFSLPLKNIVVLCFIIFFDMNSEQLRCIIHMRGQRFSEVSVGEAVKKLELSSVAGGEVKWCSHFEKHFGSSPKC